MTAQTNAHQTELSKYSHRPHSQLKQNRRLVLGFAIWTVFVAAALWWLLEGNPGPSVWVAPAPDSVQPAIAEKFRAWFKTEPGLQRAYPWVLLGPYVALLIFCFPLERRRLTLSLPINFAVCIFFVALSQCINVRTSLSRATIVVFNAKVTSTNDPSGREDITIRQELTNGPALNVLQDRLYRRVFVETTNTHIIKGTIIRGEHKLPALDELTHDLDLPPPPSHLAKWTFLSAFVDLLAYAAIGGLAHSVYFYRRLREREHRALLLESSLATSRLNALRAQLQPHFIFNTLNAITALLRHDPGSAETTLLSLSDLLRLALSQSERQEIALSEELNFIQKYMQLQQTRFGDRLQFEQDIEPASLDCLVPTLLLQPLVENAIRHGIEPADEPGTVRIAGQLQHGKLILTVSDDGVGLNPDVNAVSDEKTESEDPQFRGTGIGLVNLRARLETLYGTNQSLQIKPSPERGVVVRVEIPARSAKAASAAAHVLNES